MSGKELAPGQPGIRTVESLRLMRQSQDISDARTLIVM